MGRFTKRLITGLAAASVLAGGAFAQGTPGVFLLDDLEHGSNAHYMDNYWYYYQADDYKIIDELMAADPASWYNALITNIPDINKYGLMFEPYTDDDGNKTAAMIYDNLAMANAEAPATAYPCIGMGMLLTGDDDKGFGPAFEKVTEVSFRVKGTADTVIFKIETIKNSENQPFVIEGGKDADNPKKWAKNPANAYAKKLGVTADWVTHTVKIAPFIGSVTEHADIATTFKDGAVPTARAGDLHQLPWWGWTFEFKRSEVTKIAWQINWDFNKTKTSGTILVDDIKLISSPSDPFIYVPFDLCTDCVGKSTAAGTLVSDFEEDAEKESPRQNFLGYYWYSYDDTKAGGGSAITNLVLDSHTGDDVMPVTGDGKDGSGGAKIEYIMGSSFPQREEMIGAFVGIGTNLYHDTTNTMHYNASQAGGITFDYNTSFSAEEGVIAVEFADINDVIQSETPDGDDGQVFYLKVPGTGGQWKTATVMFKDLVLPAWVNSNEENRRYGTKLDLTKLAKIQFKYQGTGDGSIAIDNVYIGGDPVSVRRVSSAKAAASGLRATYNRGVVGVNWNSASDVKSGKISLINIKGRTVASAPIKSVGGKVSASLGNGRIPAGMYFVRVNAKDVNGKRIVQQTPVTITK